MKEQWKPCALEADDVQYLYEGVFFSKNVFHLASLIPRPLGQGEFAFPSDENFPFCTALRIVGVLTGKAGIKCCMA